MYAKYVCIYMHNLYIEENFEINLSTKMIHNKNEYYRSFI